MPSFIGNVPTRGLPRVPTNKCVGNRHPGRANDSISSSRNKGDGHGRSPFCIAKASSRGLLTCNVLPRSQLVSRRGVRGALIHTTRG